MIEVDFFGQLLLSLEGLELSWSVRIVGLVFDQLFWNFLTNFLLSIKTKLFI